MSQVYANLTEVQKAPFRHHAQAFKLLGSGFHTRKEIAAVLRRFNEKPVGPLRYGWSHVTLDDGTCCYFHECGTVLHKKPADVDRGKPEGPHTGLMQYVKTHIDLEGLQDDSGRLPHDLGIVNAIRDLVNQWVQLDDQTRSIYDTPVGVPRALNMPCTIEARARIALARSIFRT